MSTFGVLQKEALNKFACSRLFPRNIDFQRITTRASELHSFLYQRTSYFGI